MRGTQSYRAGKITPSWVGSAEGRKWRVEATYERKNVAREGLSGRNRQEQRQEVSQPQSSLDLAHSESIPYLPHDLAGRGCPCFMDETENLQGRTDCPRPQGCQEAAQGRTPCCTTRPKTLNGGLWIAGMVKTKQKAINFVPDSKSNTCPMKTGNTEEIRDLGRQLCSLIPVAY